MIRRLKSGEYRLYSRKQNPCTGQRKNLGTFLSRDAAEKHEREVRYFKRHAPSFEFWTVRGGPQAPEKVAPVGLSSESQGFLPHFQAVEKTTIDFGYGN